MNYWPHQNSIHDKCRLAYRPGSRNTVVAPCGAGKSVMMRRISIPAVEKGIRSAFYLHRRMLTKQTIEAFEKTGVEFGVIASGFKQYENPEAPIQICAMQTVAARMKTIKFEFPQADIIHIDEKHQQAHDQAEKVFQKHIEQGAVEFSWTATPVGLTGKTDRLITDANYSGMLECGAHLPVRHYGPDSPDLTKIKPMRGGDFSSEDDRRINRVPTVIARVFEYWKKLNPNALPAIGFAPGVEESQWFVSEFLRRGVPCAHIDSERTVFVRPNRNNVLESYEYPTDDSTRQEILDGSKSGKYKIIWNRFILREAIDCLDEETEVLTEKGWVGIDDPVTVGDQIWTLNTNTGEAELKPIEAKTSRLRRPGERMVRMRGLHNDIRVTEGHRFYLKYFNPDIGNGRYSKNFVIRHSRDLVDRSGDFSMPVSAEGCFIGVDLSDDWIKVLGWLVSDGGVSSHPNSKLLFIYQKKPQYVRKIRRLLTGLVEFREAKKSNGVHTFSICWKHWKDVLGDYFSKDGMDSWKDMTRKQFQVFWNALCQGDGTFPNGEGGTRNPILTVGSEKLKDLLLGMCLVRGYSCNVTHTKSSTSGNPCWNMIKQTKAFRTHRPSDDRSMSIEFENVYMPERVWCLTNENDTLITRRKGKTCIMGNCPWLYHGIAATSMGGLSTFLQTGGRVQRYWEDYDHVIWQDHSGNLERHGFLDEDREWKLGDTNNSKQRERKEAIQAKKGDEAEPICCPKCSAFRTHGPECNNCGYMHKRSIRMVRELDGTLVKKTGRTVKYKRPKQFEDIYRSALYGAVNYGGTVGQAYGRACAIAREKGVDIVQPQRVKCYSGADPEWKLKVKEVYPWVRK